MKEFIEKLIERLKEESYDMEICEEQFDMNSPYFIDVPYKMIKLDDVKEIANQLAEECAEDTYVQTIDVGELVNAENGGWIPCSERYPDTKDYILLSFSNFSVPLVGRWEEDEEGGAFYIGDEMESCASQCIFVNAWQPLPVPYQPKGE